MIFTCLHFLAGVIRRAIGPRGQVHPTAQECAEDSEPNGLEVTPEETICKTETSVDREECLTSSRNQSEVSKNGIDLLLEDRSLSVKVDDKIDIFWNSKTLIEREFYSHEFGPEEGGTSENWKVLFRQIENSLVFTGRELVLYSNPESRDRNRYRNILPYDQNRVRLVEGKNDYINASYVSVQETGQTYILTQGPMENTIGHFWEMVWEEGTVGIVMLCRCEEGGKDKCAHYWPTEKEKPILSGCYVVEVQQTVHSASHCLSYLLLHNLKTNENRTILHFRYLAWPDFGIPQTTFVFLEFLMEIRDSGILLPDEGPLIVHCSAGIGRSGVFTLIDVAISLMEHGRSLHTLDLKDLLIKLRKQRLGLVQTEQQLRFAYTAILTAAHDLFEFGQSIPDLRNEVKCFIANIDRSKPKKCLGPDNAIPRPRPSPSPSPSLSSLFSIASYSSYTSSHSSQTTALLSPSTSSLHFPSQAYYGSPVALLPEPCTTSPPQPHGSPGPVVCGSDSNVETREKKTKGNWFKRLRQRLFRRKKRKK